MRFVKVPEFGGLKKGNRAKHHHSNGASGPVQRFRLKPLTGRSLFSLRNSPGHGEGVGRGRGLNSAAPHPGFKSSEATSADPGEKKKRTRSPDGF